MFTKIIQEAIYAPTLKQKIKFLCIFHVQYAASQDIYIFFKINYTVLLFPFSIIANVLQSR